MAERGGAGLLADTNGMRMLADYRQGKDDEMGMMSSDRGHGWRKGGGPDCWPTLTG